MQNDEEKMSIFAALMQEDENSFLHFGIPRRSGRYPWGSGKDPYQDITASGKSKWKEGTPDGIADMESFLKRVHELDPDGTKRTSSKGRKEIATKLGCLVGDFDTQMTYVEHYQKELQRQQAITMKQDGKSGREIAERLGLANESSVRSLTKEASADFQKRGTRVADELERALNNSEYGIIDVGKGVANQLRVSQNVLDEAIFIMCTRGYNYFGLGIPQVTNPGRQINRAVLRKQGISEADVYNHMDRIEQVRIDSISDDGGETFRQVQRPQSISSDRIAVCYADEGGRDMDGVIQLRRGVEDLSLGNSHYSQVRILVDGTHYIKGMAIYSDDMPPGKDIIFNTSKGRDVPMLGDSKSSILKPVKDDPDNPFGATILPEGQSEYVGSDGKKHLSAINKLKDEGVWEDMSKNLSSQFLSKQPVPFIRRQLEQTRDDYIQRFEEIKALTNPAVKQKLLEDFADSCESAAVTLKASDLPGQTTQVLLPVPSLKDNEVYAPNYKPGTIVSLIRYPHGGTFEIPQLVVTDKSPEGDAIVGKDTKDAIGVNKHTLDKLSGADCDGDQVVVIPESATVHVTARPMLKELEGFEPKDEYSTVGKTGVRLMRKQEIQLEMGQISNLITDMTLRGASTEEIARADKHSMVIIDAYKHKLDYKQSEIDQGIAELKRLYQGHYKEDGGYSEGASTLLSAKGHEVAVPERQGKGRIDKNTGELIFNETGREYVDAKGNIVQATTKIPKILAVDDVHIMSSGTEQERLYADHANYMKELARQVRLELVNTPNLTKNREAAQTYSAEVASLKEQLNEALKNAPREARAQAIANGHISEKKREHRAKAYEEWERVKQQVKDLTAEGLTKKAISERLGYTQKELRDIVNGTAKWQPDKDYFKKLAQKELKNARAAVGAHRVQIDISDRQWEAIQAGALSHTTVVDILRFADQDRVKQLATPRAATRLSDAQKSKIERLKSSGNYTNAQIAEALGVSVSTVQNYAEL